MHTLPAFVDTQANSTSGTKDLFRFTIEEIETMLVRKARQEVVTARVTQLFCMESVVRRRRRDECGC